MLFSTAFHADISTSMTHNFSASTLCPLLLRSFMMNNTLSNITNINAHNRSTAPSTNIIFIKLVWLMLLFPLVVLILVLIVVGLLLLLFLFLLFSLLPLVP